jgi:hypothetical protein
LSHQLRTIILKIDKMFFVRVHATRAYDDVANNKNNETISNLKLIQYNLKNKQATPPRLNPHPCMSVLVLVFVGVRGGLAGSLSWATLVSPYCRRLRVWKI